MNVRILSAVVFVGLAASLPVAAHHSVAAEYDAEKPVKVTGVVTKVEWLNPHVWFYVDEKAEGGKVNHWAFSGGAPGQLMRRGIMKDVIQPGMTVVVEGFRAKDGSNNANGTKVTFPDGRMVFTASGNEPGSEKKN
jgi:DNA/RNA endonuclease YhcR with UshA esterase domain